MHIATKCSFLKYTMKKEDAVTCGAFGLYQVECINLITIAHVITRKYKTLKRDPKNIIHLCEAHRRYFNTEAGQKEWGRFVKKYFPHKYEYVVRQYEFVLAEYKDFMKWSGGGEKK